MIDDQFFARRVGFAFHRHRFEFDLARTVFASANIDPGSSLLLRHLQTIPPPAGGSVLDLGCGIGTLGIVLAGLDRDREVSFVDRDALALRYTRSNLVLNELVVDADQARVSGSLGFDQLDGGGPFDLVVSNIPGKVGEDVIAHLVTEATNRVRAPGGMVAFVIVKPLGPLLAELFERCELETVLHKGNKSHEVFIGRPGPESRQTSPAAGSGRGFEDGLYDRLTGEFSVGKLGWSATTVYGLDEFDNLAHGSRMLHAALQGVRGGRSIVINPGQGHRAVIAAVDGHRPEVVAGRDLLALKAATRMLVDNGFDAPIEDHVVALDIAESLNDERSVVILNAEDGVHTPWLYAQITAILDGFDERRPSSFQLIISGRSSVLGRLEADLLARRRRGHVAYKKSKEGHRIVRYSVGV